MSGVTPDDVADLERQLAADVHAMDTGHPVLLSIDDLRRLQPHIDLFDLQTLLLLARHPNVPLDWVRKTVDDPDAAGIPFDSAHAVHSHLADNPSVPGDVLGLILAEHPSGELDEHMLRNPSLNAQALHTVVMRVVPTPVRWKELLYTHLAILDAYAHPKLADRTGRYLTRVMLDAVADVPERDDDYHVVAVQTIIPTFEETLAAACIKHDRADWFTDEERSRLLVSVAAR